jgi:hypothetical protein
MSPQRLATLTLVLHVAAAGAGWVAEGAMIRPRLHPVATGTLVAYDGAARVLTLRMATGLAVYHVAEDARLWLGRRRLPVRRLGGYLGAQATVTYVEKEGERVTHTIRLRKDDAASP